MRTIVDPEIEKYCAAISSHPSALAAELEGATRQKFPQGAKMLTGPLAASFMGVLIRIGRVRRVLELGTFTGYSALCMAENLPEDGEVITLDVDPRPQELAKTFWARSPHGKKIKSLLGPALEWIPKLEGTFDLVFVDADKQNSLNYFEALYPRLSETGFMIFDNSLWDGRVIEPDGDSTTRGIIELNNSLKERDDIFRSLISVRDGAFVILPKR